MQQSWHLNIVLGGLAAVLMVLDYLTHRSLALRREKAPEAPSHASPSLHALGWYDRGFRPALLERLQTEFIPRRATALHEEVAISLRMEAQATQVKPSFIVAPIGAKPNTPWPKDTTIMDVFAAKEVQYKLLILGELGAGKTTTLLELALHLLTEAKQDPDQPVPIIFECSTWHGQSIIAWLAQQMQERYKILPDMGCRLVEAQAILPLLEH